MTERNEVLGKELRYTYNAAGNRTSVTTITLSTNASTTVSLTYGSGAWGDALASYNGETITYDSLGNPLGYYNYRTFEWDGRQFLGAWAGPGYFYGYTYDDTGRRIQKTGEGMTTDYVYDGDRMIAEVSNWYTIVYIYDDGNVPIGMLYRASDDTLWTEYWFEKNLQGDIIAIWTHGGVKCVSYTYDAWGNYTSKTHYNDGVGGYSNNRFLYRGYYWDGDLGLYWTQTRLYDPVTGRFINPDSFVSTGQGILGNNMYLYCGNDPVNRVDPSGNFFIELFAVVAVAFLVLSTVDNVTNQLNASNNAAVDFGNADAPDNQIVENQGEKYVKNYTYGFFSLSRNGCEIIAVHNARVLLYQESDFSDVIHTFNMKHAMLGVSGFLGSNPYCIGNVLDSYGMSYTMVNANQMTVPGVYIASYWIENAPMIHTIAIEYDGEHYTPYNKYNGKFDPSTLGNRYICGYYLG